MPAEEVLTAAATLAAEAAAAAEGPCAPAACIELLAAGATAAEVARRAGHDELADGLARRAADAQVSRIRAAMTDDGSAAAEHRFDSLRARVVALCAALDVRPAPRDDVGGAAAADDDDDVFAELPDALPICSVCLDKHVDTALTPCFHCSFCSECAAAISSQGLPCPICRGRVRGHPRVRYVRNLSFMDTIQLTVPRAPDRINNLERKRARKKRKNNLLQDSP